MITMRELALDDAVAVQRIYQGASVAYTRGRPMGLADATAHVANACAQARAVPRECWSFGIAAGTDLIGLITIRALGAGRGTLSYILREDSWGCGHGTAAVRQAVAYAFSATRLDRLSARHHPGNPASGRVLVKAGFRPVASVRRGRDAWLGYEIRRPG